jgi:hypothetical protein
MKRSYVHALTHLINFFGAIDEPPHHKQRDHRALFAFGADRFEALFC